MANGVKSRCHAALTEVHHKLQRAELLTGISRTYQPRDDDGEPLPPESKRVQYRASDGIEAARASLSRLFDIVATQDKANCLATADVVVNGGAVATDVPVTTLLFLEKQLVDLHTFVSKLPVLDPAYDWEFSEESNSYATAPAKTVKTKKVPRNHVKYEATKEHPAQVEVFTEDIAVGDWTTTHFSGAIPERQRVKILERVRQLQDAVKVAREQANSLEVTDVKLGDAVLGYVFGNSASSDSR